MREGVFFNQRNEQRNHECATSYNYSKLHLTWRHEAVQKGSRDSRLSVCVTSGDVDRRMDFGCLMAFTYSLSLSLGHIEVNDCDLLQVCFCFLTGFSAYCTFILCFTYWSSLFSDCSWIPQNDLIEQDVLTEHRKSLQSSVLMCNQWHWI